MGIVEEYLKNKKIKEMELPKLFIVKSTRLGVDKPIERQVESVREGVSYRIDGKERTRIDRYGLGSQYPYEVDMLLGETSTNDCGYGTGTGDLWQWGYFSSFSEDEANGYYEAELKRVTEKYSFPDYDVDSHNQV